MVLASFGVFFVACIMAFVFFPIGFILWLASVVMFFVGIGQRPQRIQQNVIIQQQAPQASIPFQYEGRWWSNVNGQMLLWNELSQRWEPPPPTPIGQSQQLPAHAIETTAVAAQRESAKVVAPPAAPPPQSFPSPLQ